jgi:hypothetical protein
LVVSALAGVFAGTTSVPKAALTKQGKPMQMPACAPLVSLIVVQPDKMVMIAIITIVFILISLYMRTVALRRVRWFEINNQPEWPI